MFITILGWITLCYLVLCGILACVSWLVDAKVFTGFRHPLSLVRWVLTLPIIAVQSHLEKRNMRTI